ARRRRGRAGGLRTEVQAARGVGRARAREARSLRRAQASLVAMCAVVVMVVVTALAIGDHNRKNRTTAKAEIAEWYCEHHSTQCGGPKSDALEDAWNRRELGYKVADVTLLAVGAVAVSSIWRRRR